MVEALKTAIIIRKDLDIPTGKWIAQSVHALLRTNPKGYKDKEEHQRAICVVLEVDSDLDFEQIIKRCEKINIPYGIQIDSGHNFVEPGTKTCMAVGPAPERQINKVTGNLRLFRK